jgi:starvation-inducible outer membrane lipoprotein
MAIRAFVNVSIAGVCLFVLSSCGAGHYHAISNDMRQKAAKGLSLQQVRKNPDSYAGQTVVWGGVIAGYQSGPEGVALTVAETPLDNSSLPKDKRFSRGNFIAWTKHLDPEIYEEGRKITLAGEVLGKGGQSNTAPAVRIKEIHLWNIVGHQRGRPFDWDVYPDHFYKTGR